MDHDSKADAIPAPGDLAGWKRVASQLTQRFVEHLNQGPRPRSPEALWRYFDDEDVPRIIRDHEKRGVLPAYGSWVMLDYRPRKNSQTRAEQLLAKGLPPAQELLMRAMLQAPPSLYRVTGHDAKQGTVDLEDVLLGGNVTVHDQLMSQHTQNGWYVAARTFPAGQFHFFEMIGPPLGAGQGFEAIDFLQDNEMEFTPEGQTRDAHKFGWLWIWTDECAADWQQPELCNTDGEKLLFHTASFTCDDPAAVRKTLLERDDIEHDEEVDELVWSKVPEKKMPYETITLGRLAFVDDELVLTVNSAERFAAARAWLSKIPGVTFESLTTRDSQAASHNHPLDDRLAKPVEPTPEMLEGLQQQFDQYYMNWLDQPLPALGGLTPRQASQNPKKREQVIALIRTMPDPLGNTSVRAPREALLRELGLSSQPKPKKRAPAPTAGDPNKVRRNEPCPCGSGRKFKQCCGRPLES